MKSIIAITIAMLFHTPFINSVLADGPAACEKLKTGKIKKYKLEEGKTLPFAINKRLSKSRGNIKRGRKVFLNTDSGNCIACHAVKKLQNKVDPDKFITVRTYGAPGSVGPPLDGIGERYTIGELRAIVVDPKLAFPTKDVTMPAYYKLEGLHDVSETCVGKTILSEGQIEDLVTYLRTLK